MMCNLVYKSLFKINDQTYHAVPEFAKLFWTTEHLLRAFFLDYLNISRIF
jgi:hypothetical protein